MENINLVLHLFQKKTLIREKSSAIVKKTTTLVTMKERDRTNDVRSPRYYNSLASPDTPTIRIDFFI
jgi:hypothetical protein